MGTLYLVATPIGNLEDMTLRALRILREVPLIAAEDTRRTRILLRHYDIDAPLISYHAHNEQARREQLLAHLDSADLALVSDAGSPGLSDPGHDLVMAAREHGHPVVPVPGPSALIAAITAAGSVPNHFTYLGFLPRRRSDAAAVLSRVRELPHPIVVFEAPHRLAATLHLLAEQLGDREATVARELTKVHEEFRRGTLSELGQAFTIEPPRGELVVIVQGAPPEVAVGSTDVESLLRRLLQEGSSPSQAARLAAQHTNVARRELYRVAMRLAQQPEESPANQTG